jgi:hypothetical protein
MTRIRRISGNAFRGTAALLLFFGIPWLGTQALEKGTVPLTVIIVFAIATLLFWIGDELNPDY